MKQLILHIGCCKTGSSALQSWFAQNQLLLAEQGLAFRITNKAALELKFNVGNAGPFEQMLKNRGVDEDWLADFYFRGLDRAIISGERLEVLDEALMEQLHQWSLKRDVKITVVCYVRNVYDFHYSAYLQSVKRRNQTQPFSTYVDDVHGYRHTKTATRWSKFFDVRLIHYDHCRNDVAGAFCRVVGIDGALLQPLSPRKVNRGLTSDEQVVIQQMVKWLEAGAISRPDDFSSLVCDDLVNDYPDESVEFVLDQEALHKLEAKLADDLDRFNQGIGGDQGIRLEFLGDQPYANPPDASKLDPAALQRMLKLLRAHEQELGSTVVAEVARRAAVHLESNH